MKYGVVILQGFKDGVADEYSQLFDSLDDAMAAIKAVTVPWIACTLMTEESFNQYLVHIAMERMILDNKLQCPVVIVSNKEKISD